MDADRDHPSGSPELSGVVRCVVDRVVAPAASPSGDDGHGFVELYDRSVGDVYSYLMSRVGDRAVAEDLTQEVFLAGARRVSVGEAVETGWLIAVARNKLVDHWRAQAREERRRRAWFSSRSASSSVVEEVAVAARVETALARVNVGYRMALVLRHVDGLSVPEVAACLRRSVAATEQVLSRARAAFRVAYREAGDV